MPKPSHRPKLSHGLEKHLLIDQIQPHRKHSRMEGLMVVAIAVVLATKTLLPEPVVVVAVDDDRGVYIDVIDHLPYVPLPQE